MNTFILIFTVFYTIVVIIGVRMLIRNERVCKFRMWIINELVFRDIEGWRKRDAIYRKVTYGQMVRSFKKLQIENFYSLEDCHILSEGLITN